MLNSKIKFAKKIDCSGGCRMGVKLLQGKQIKMIQLRCNIAQIIPGVTRSKKVFGVTSVRCFVFKIKDKIG